MTEKYKKTIDYKTLISAAIISALIFGGGIFTGYVFSKERLITVETELENVINDIQNFQLQFLFLDVLGENATCPLLEATLSEINERAYELWLKLTGHEVETGINDYSKSMKLKSDYSRLLVNYWLMAEKMKKACSSNTSTVLYMFSLNSCYECENQEFILTYFKEKYGDKILIFAVDGEFDEPSINTLRVFYDVTIYPTLVIDGKLYEGFVSQKELESILRL